MSTLWEMSVWAEGQAHDADGNPLDRDGNVISTPESSEDEDNATEENPK